MATYDLEEQEQLEELKTWWKLHGTWVTSIVTALAVAVVGWQGWNWWQRSQAAQAGELYAAMQQAMSQQDTKRMRLLAGELIDKYAGTAYAGMGALLSGKALAESGDLKSAAAQYGWAAEHARDEALRDLARLRQALVLAEAQDYEAALKLLAVPPAPSFKARYLEARGDVLLAQGKREAARQAYGDAIEALEAERKNAEGPTDAYLDILRAKRDACGGAA
ncbi:MAG: tetratricopeptide repeat protein [Rhodocyclaceae bacterium]|nr:tetratricopeptide repeat protein [Rhodocyclaceae bacterium]